MRSMNKHELKVTYEEMTPDEVQIARMRRQILTRSRIEGRGMKIWSKRRLQWLAVPAVCLVLVLAFFLVPFGPQPSAYAIQVKVGEEGAVFTLRDDGRGAGNNGTSISHIDPRPGLEFYITGDNIAKIQMSAENEYLYAVDWTKTQHEKYWNTEYYQHFDEERQVYVADSSLLFDKTMTMEFPEGFTGYDQIWYRWTAWNMYKWAAEDNFSRFQGVGDIPADASEQEKLELAAGDKSAAGHMQLKDYPEELKKDKITITITDRQGKRTTKVIHVQVSNNEIGQTVVTASLAN